MSMVRVASTVAVVVLLSFATFSEGRRVQVSQPSSSRLHALGDRTASLPVDATEQPEHAATVADATDGVAKVGPSAHAADGHGRVADTAAEVVGADIATNAAAAQPDNHEASEPAGLLTLARLGRVTSQLQRAVAAKLHGAPKGPQAVQGVQGVQGGPMTLPMFLEEVQRDPFSPKVLPIVISGILATALVACMCCTCCGKRASHSDYRECRGNTRHAQRAAAQRAAHERLSEISSDEEDGRSDALDIEDRGSREPSMFGSRRDPSMVCEQRREPGSSTRDRSPGGKSSSHADAHLEVRKREEGAIGSRPRMKTAEQTDADALLLKEIQDLAAQTARTVQKYPKSGRSFFSKSRHVATLPAAERPGTSDGKAKDPRRLVHRWRNGTFGWWESEEAFLKGDDPKGSMDLKAILKVQTWKDEKSGRGVLVKYNASSEKNEMEPAEMIIMFERKLEADEWGFAFWQLLNKLRQKAQPAPATCSAPAEKSKVRFTDADRGDER